MSNGNDDDPRAPGYRRPRAGRPDFDDVPDEDAAVSYPPGSGLNYQPRDQTPFPPGSANQFANRSSSYEKAQKYIARDRRDRDVQQALEDLEALSQRVRVLYQTALANGLLDAAGNPIKVVPPNPPVQNQIVSDMELKRLKLWMGLGTALITIIGGLLMAAIKLWGS